MPIIASAEIVSHHTEMHSMYKCCVTYVKQLLSTSSIDPSITTDAWTSSSQDGFISLMLYMLSDDFQSVVTISLGVIKLLPTYDAA